MLEMKESERFGWNDVLNDEVLVGVKIKLEKNLIFNEY